MTAPTTARPYVPPHRYQSPGKLGGRVNWGPDGVAAEARRRADHAELITALAAVPAADVPCLSGATLPSSAWTSDDQELQEAAASACGPCPVFDACRTYALGNAAEAGTYGGLTDRDRLNSASVARLRRAHNEETHV